ncbi:MAG: hypothetical protein H0T42_04745 [Deltaproteobacteria bacterium]|nr:hypothetical protein [Deltaproteobacteria bacterium]
MTKISLAAVLVLAMMGTARAGGQAGTIGVGAEYGLRFGGAVGGGDDGMGGGGGSPGLGLASMNYDAGGFHTGAFLGFSDGGGDDDTSLAIGGRFFFHLHSGSMSDFSLGGNLGLVSIPTGGDDSASLVFLEPAMQIRLFPASNVALSFTVGIAIGLVDADGYGIEGQPTGAAGVHYYFF